MATVLGWTLVTGVQLWRFLGWTPPGAGTARCGCAADGNLVTVLPVI